MGQEIQYIYIYISNFTFCLYGMKHGICHLRKERRLWYVSEQGAKEDIWT